MTARPPQKRPRLEIPGNSVKKAYKFRILLPNGTCTGLTLHEPGREMSITDFVKSIRKELTTSWSRTTVGKREIMWNGNIYFEDMHENEIRGKISFGSLSTNQLNILRLHDGIKETVNTFQDMWDLTPDTDLLAELPAEYTFETALADLIDNSLQAVWENSQGERRLIRVNVNEDVIMIYDTGPGMDGSEENSIVKWGKMGSSNHRASRGKGMGGKPPYLMPYFGMFGYGGTIASMHLGRRAVVSSKTKKSKKVYTLHIERDALLNKSGSKHGWKTDGGIREPSEEEIKMSAHCSFTKVNIFEPKLKAMETWQLACRLKDMYFPYIQCDEVHGAGQTVRLIEFQVNDVDLTEIDGGEVAITNLNSCNGPDFSFEVCFQTRKDAATCRSQGASFKVNARLKCMYFPIVEGKESIDRILEKLRENDSGITESFESFSRVSIRRLGRLLPDARWGMLPFMDLRFKKGEHAQVLKRCCLRVKCFIDTDAGFSPMPAKTDLAHHDPFTVGLRNFGSKVLGKDSDVTFEVQKDGSLMTLSQLEKAYLDWLLKMHEGYDEEIDCGEDQPVLVVNPTNKKRLGVSAGVVRVHKIIRRKGVLWESGQKLKIFKGAPGCSKNSLYATLEYILLEGFQGDVGGNARLICRPIDCSVENGCLLSIDDENPSLDICGSLSFPISIIDSGKCQAVDNAVWSGRLLRKQQEAPSFITVLGAEQCSHLGIDGVCLVNWFVHLYLSNKTHSVSFHFQVWLTIQALPAVSPTFAGSALPTNVVAVFRPAKFPSDSLSLEQKNIIKDDLEMLFSIKYFNDEEKLEEGETIVSEIIRSTSCRGIHGLYIFPLRSRLKDLFRRAGLFVFSFYPATNSSCKGWESRVVVQPSKAEKWGLKHSELMDGKLVVRTGEVVPPVSIVCFDKFHNRTSFVTLPEVSITVKTREGGVLARVDKLEAALASDKMSLEIKGIAIESSELDLIKPNYEARLEICSQEKFSVAALCQVFPGSLHTIRMRKCFNLQNCLLPGAVIGVLCLELLDACGNHILEDNEVDLHLEGLVFLDSLGTKRKANDQGYLDLSGLLKVACGYGTRAHLSVVFGGKCFFRKEFDVQKRELRIVSEIPKSCIAGCQLEDVVFEIVGTNNEVDELIHGPLHSLTIKSSSSCVNDTVQYIFQRGRCTVPFITIPQGESTFRFVASHSCHPELQITAEILVLHAPKLELIALTEADGNMILSPCSEKRVLPCQGAILSKPHAMHHLITFILNEQMELEKASADAKLLVETCETNLKSLCNQKMESEQEIFDLQGTLEPQSANHLDHLMNSRERVAGRVKGLTGTAAAFVCNSSKTIQPRQPVGHLMKDVVGVVALLATVDCNNLSGILAQYLGEDYMLAIVCKSCETAAALEKYGATDLTAETGRQIKDRFLVICLDNIRPFSKGFIGNDSQKKLALPNPVLPSGRTPRGFVGYAVNLIHVDVHQSKTRTKAGFGLRETLFYQLFQKLQVYRTKEDMNRAADCIETGAVSMDGGILKGNAVTAIGDWKPNIVFPVVNSDVQRYFRRNSVEQLNEIESKLARLEALRDEIADAEKALAQACNKFQKKTKRLEKFMRERPPL